MEDSNETEATALPIRKKQPRQQLTKGMEHMRDYVTIQDTASASLPSTDLGEDAYGVPASYQPLRRPASPSKSDNPEKRSDPFQFGTRYLSESDDIFSHNAWDHVEVDPQYSAFITAQTAFQREHAVSDFDKRRFNDAPAKWWDRFYGNNAANFFKDRKWLVQEFPILGDVTADSYGPVTLLEVGAGAGNTAFPLVKMNRNAELRLHACDYSKKAVDLMRAQPAYSDSSTNGVLRADVWDVAGEALPPSLEPASVDVVILIFVFSALEPSQWARAVRNIWNLLKPGGRILFRDYGRGDLAQVRFKKGRYLEENFYVRGDGTRVYFFEEEELRHIWSGAIWLDRSDGIEGDQSPEQQGAVQFEITNLATDRRMLVNRQRKLKMYRCWMQGLFKKPSVTTTCLDDPSHQGSGPG